MKRKFIACFMVFATLLVQQTVLAQTSVPATGSSEAISESSPTTESRRAQAIRKLLAIKEALEDKRGRVRDLLEQLASADEIDKAKINEQIASLRETIDALTKSFENIAVSGASASSLDYLIYATMDGHSADSYFAIRRMIQQTCVDICNQEGWVIPFAYKGDI